MLEREKFGFNPTCRGPVGGATDGWPRGVTDLEEAAPPVGPPRGRYLRRATKERTLGLGIVSPIESNWHLNFA